MTARSRFGRLNRLTTSPFSLRLEGFDRVASRVQYLAFPVEEFGQAFP